jgi:hypothetical protein
MAAGCTMLLHADSNIEVTQLVAGHWLRVHSFATIALPSSFHHIPSRISLTAAVDYPLNSSRVSTMALPLPILRCTEHELDCRLAVAQEFFLKSSAPARLPLAATL